MRIRLRDGVVPGIARFDLIARIAKGAIGIVTIAIFRGREQRAATDLPATAEIRVQHLAIGMRGRSALQFELERLGVRLQHQIEHAGDGVGPILRCRAVAKDLDAVDGGSRDGIEIGARRSAPDGVVHVDQRAGVNAFTVDHHQHLVGPKSTQRCRTDGIRAVGDRRSREVE